MVFQAIRCRVASQARFISPNQANKRFSSAASSPTPSTSNFDTFQVVNELRKSGMSQEQSEAVLRVLTIAMNESIATQSQVLATKSEHVELKAALSEKVFNSTLKFDIAQRHMRELLERDFNNLKSEIRTLETHDMDIVRKEINSLEKKLLVAEQAEEEFSNRLTLEIEKAEKRMLQYAMGFAGTILAVNMGIARLFK